MEIPESYSKAQKIQQTIVNSAKYIVSPQEKAGGNDSADCRGKLLPRWAGGVLGDRKILTGQLIKADLNST